MTASRIRLQYIGAIPITLVFPTRQISVAYGDEVDLLPIEADGIAGREDFISAVDQAQATTPTPEPDDEPDANPDSEVTQ